MKIDGSCHCGLITFEAEIDPKQVHVCHCTDCQSLSASAFRVAVPAPADKFSMSGEPTIYIKTGESGVRRIQTFCPRCGSAIYSADADVPPTDYNIRVGTIRQRHDLLAKLQYWTRSHPPWVGSLASVPRMEKQ